MRYCTSPDVEERRRSERLWLTIPVRIEGEDPNGALFESAGRAINLNRHGARIQVSRPLRTGDPVLLKSAIGHFESEFRVVEPITPPSTQGGVYGVECLSDGDNFWGIEFPSAGDETPAEARALLECRMCNTIALLVLTLTEVETLRSIGLLCRPCRVCGVSTPWRYAEMRVPPRSDPAAQWDSVAVGSRRFAALCEPMERGHRRVYMQLPLAVHDATGEVEVSQTENLSRSGLCFVSARTYLTGEIVRVMCPLNPDAENIQLPARIVRAQDIEGSDCKFYGATFEAQTSPTSRAPKPIPQTAEEG